MLTKVSNTTCNTVSNTINTTTNLITKEQKQSINFIYENIQEILMYYKRNKVRINKYVWEEWK